MGNKGFRNSAHLGDGGALRGATVFGGARDVTVSFVGELDIAALSTCREKHASVSSEASNSDCVYKDAVR